MSFNQSRPEKSESQQYRKTGRSSSFGQTRSSAGGGKGGGGGVAGGTAPPSLSPNRSFNRRSNNAQGGQFRVSSSNVNLESSNASAARNVQNGAHIQPPLHGASDAPVAGVAAKPTDLSTQKSTPRAAVPKAPSSHSASVGSDMMPPTTPAKAPGDASRAFSLQFGSLSPGLMNGMQIPARTSSAPPNLDEQKRDQVRHESLRSVPTVPIPSTPKQQQHLPRKDAGTVGQSNIGEVQSMSKVKRDVQVSSTPPATQTQKPSVLPVPGLSMAIPFPQPQVSLQFGGPNPQMPMPLPLGNAPQVQHQVFLPGLQTHQMQAQGIMHQGQSLNFTPQMGPQLPPQLGIGITPQYPQQQAGKFGGSRITVKITHPDTHEELRLDGSSGPRSHPNVPPQSQPIPSFSSPNYYPNSYNPRPPLFFTPPSSIPLTSSQITPSSQPQRFSYPVSQGPQTISFLNPALNSLSVNKTGTPLHGIVEPSNLEHARDVHSVISAASSPTVQVTVKPAVVSLVEKVAGSSLSISSPPVEKGESPKPSRPPREAGILHPQKDSEICSESSLQQSKFGVEPSASTSPPVGNKQSDAASAAVSVESPASNTLSSTTAPPQDSESVVINTEGRKRETISRSNSIKDHQKKAGKKGHPQPQHQAGGQSTSISSLHSRALEHSMSSNSGVSETVEAKTTIAPSGTSEGMLESSREQLSTIHAATPDASESKTGSVGEGSTCESYIMPGAGIMVDTLDTVHHAKQGDFSPHGEQLKHESVGTKEQEEIKLPEGPKQDNNKSEISSKYLEVVKQTEQDSLTKVATICNVVGSLEATQRVLDEPVNCRTEVDNMADNLVTSTSTTLDSINDESVPPSLVLSTIAHGDKTSTLDASSSRSDSMGSKEAAVKKSGVSDHESALVPTPCLSESTLKHEGEGAENISGGLVSLPVSGSKDKPMLEPNRAKSTVSKGKKKRKEAIQKADAAGTTSDLYMAYKGPEEKKGTVISSESTESTSSINLKQELNDATQEDVLASEKGAQSKSEPDDWEDAADISTPKLETSDNGEQVNGGLMHHDRDGNGVMAKKYSRDFLLKFLEQRTDLPDGFEITSDLADALMCANVNISHVDRESYPSPGRIIDRPTAGSRPDRRGSGMVEDDRWSKPPSSFASGRDLRLDIGYGNVVGFRPGQGGNYGVLRHPRAQAPVQYAGGILSGPMQSVGSQGGMQRNSPDSERWQRATGFQKGLIPSPQTPLQVMHKAENKYEVGKVTDEEQAKQRQLKAILNKLTPQNFEKLFEQVKAVNIDNADTLTGVISQIFDKALMEPTFCEMYANFCSHLAGELPDFSGNNEKITFKRLLLNKCQEEFERGVREQEEANRVDEEGEIKQSKEEREEKRIMARRRMLGNIRLIGELYKKKMLTERIMHECIKKLLGQYPDPDEEDVEALCKLMSTIGEMIDHPIAKEHMDVYFDMMAQLSNNMKLSSRVRFMLLDSIDLRKNKWQQRRKVEGPKKIEEVHRDAAQERQAQASRLARGPSINSSARRGQPIDFGPRGSTMLSSPNTQMGGPRGLTTRGYGTQDVRLEERHSFESRTLSVPLPQRPIGDESITLGPQGGLARGMSIRGPPSMSSIPLPDISPSPGDSRRMTAGMNGYSSVSERTTYNSREDLIPRYIPERFVGPSAYDQSSAPERNIHYGNRDVRNPDRSIDRSLATSPPTRVQGPALTQNVPSEKVWPAEHLRDMSIATIKEFYSVRDEKEVASCIKDLNTPGFYPSMISIWVTDSFERKDMDRDLLTMLLVNLTKSHDGILSQVQLIKGFESVLSTLEDAVNDAPKAAEFLGHIFAKVILENVIPLRDIGLLLNEGGEVPGRLLEMGLAAEVLGSVLEIIRSEEGESVLNEIRKSSNLQLEDFRPPDSTRSKKLDKFI